MTMSFENTLASRFDSRSRLLPVEPHPTDRLENCPGLRIILKNSDFMMTLKFCDPTWRTVPRQHSALSGRRKAPDEEAGNKKSKSIVK